MINKDTIRRVLAAKRNKKNPFPNQLTVMENVHSFDKVQVKNLINMLQEHYTPADEVFIPDSQFEELKTVINTDAYLKKGSALTFASARGNLLRYVEDKTNKVHWFFSSELNKMMQKGILQRPHDSKDVEVDADDITPEEKPASV